MLPVMSSKTTRFQKNEGQEETDFAERIEDAMYKQEAKKFIYFSVEEILGLIVRIEY